MRIECESCKEVVVATFVIDGASLHARCPACEVTMTANVEPRQRAATPDSLPSAEACPKCGTPRCGESACPSCGLAAERMAAFEDERDSAVLEPVRAEWQRVLEVWDDSTRHDELMRLVAIHNCYAWTAARYRDASRSRKGDSVVDRQLDRLRRAAEATMLATATVRRDPNSKPYRAATGVLVMLIVAIVVGVLYMMVIRDRGTPATAEATPAASALPQPEPQPEPQPLAPAKPLPSAPVR